MVKLRVTARVIPEDAYLAALEEAPAPHAQIRGEKRFLVVVREPQEWRVGTLALEIKKGYERIYKQEVGPIKYLKEGGNDCDLDPELWVADALVDEGKALNDPSDQHVEIKVVQEQGRGLRMNSVVPDLSQAHYRLPEHPAPSPVPIFENVKSTLGKRKPEHEEEPSTKRKRTRLDEIEEEQLVKSVEGMDNSRHLESEEAGGPQESPERNDTSRITPRLVHSGVARRNWDSISDTSSTAASTSSSLKKRARRGRSVHRRHKTPDVDKEAEEEINTLQGTTQKQPATSQSTSTRVLPPGMTPEEYDRFVRSNAHLNSAKPNETKITPSAASKATSNTANKQNGTKPAAASFTLMPPPPPSSSVTNNSSEATPTPTLKLNPRSKSATSKSTSVTPATVKPFGTTKSVKKPSPIPSAATAKPSGSAKPTKGPSPSPSSSTTKSASKPTSEPTLPVLPTSTSKPLDTRKSTKGPSPSPSPSATASVSTAKPTSKPTPPVLSTKTSKPPGTTKPTKGSSPSPSTSTTKSLSTTKPVKRPPPSTIPSSSKAASRPTPPTLPPTTSKPTSKPPTRPPLAPNFSTARTLIELRAMMNSTDTSATSSPAPAPAPSVPRLTQLPKKGFKFGEDDDDDSSSTDSSV